MDDDLKVNYNSIFEKFTADFEQENQDKARILCSNQLNNLISVTTSSGYVSKW